MLQKYVFQHIFLCILTILMLTINISHHICLQFINPVTLKETIAVIIN